MTLFQSWWHNLTDLQDYAECLRADLDRHAAAVMRWNTGDMADWDAFDEAQRGFDECARELRRVEDRIVEVGGDVP